MQGPYEDWVGWGRYCFHRCLSVHTGGTLISGCRPLPNLWSLPSLWSHGLSRGYPSPKGGGDPSPKLKGGIPPPPKREQQCEYLLCSGHYARVPTRTGKPGKLRDVFPDREF